MTTATKERKPTYKIFVLDSEEYDSLHKYYPMKKEDLKDSLGFASAKTKEAFIRRTNVPEWDEATILHEAEELLAKDSEHEDENNIRWKKGKNIFANIIPSVVGLALAPFTGGLSLPLALGIPALGAAATSAITQKNMSDAKTINPLGVALSGLGGGLGAAAMGPAMAASSTGTYLGKLGSGLLGTAPVGTKQAATSGLIGSGGKLLGIGAAPTGSVGYPAGTPVGTQNMGTWSKLAPMGSPVSSVPQVVGSGQSLGMGAALGNAATKAAYEATVGSVAPYGVYGNPTNIAGANPTLAQSNFSSNILGSEIGSGIGNLTNKITPASVAQAPATQAPVEAAPKTTWMSTLGKKTGELLTEPKNLLGGGLTLASTMGKQPEYPEIDIETIRTSLLSGQGVSPLGQQARKQLSDIMSAKPGELYPTGTDAYYQSALRQIKQSYSRAQESLAKRYNLIDPNYQQNGEYQELARRLDVELANVESDYAVSEEQRRFELQRTQQYQAIQQALQLDDSAMQDLIGLTGMSINQAAAKYQVQADDVNEIRKALGGLGGQLISSGMQLS